MLTITGLHHVSLPVGRPGARSDSKDDLMLWDLRLTELGVEHSGPRDAHLGWALDIAGRTGRASNCRLDDRDGVRLVADVFCYKYFYRYPIS